MSPAPVTTAPTTTRQSSPPPPPVSEPLQKYPGPRTLSHRRSEASRAHRTGKRLGSKQKMTIGVLAGAMLTVAGTWGVYWGSGDFRGLQIWEDPKIIRTIPFSMLNTTPKKCLGDTRYAHPHRWHRGVAGWFIGFRPRNLVVFRRKPRIIQFSGLKM